MERRKAEEAGPRGPLRPRGRWGRNGIVGFTGKNMLKYYEWTYNDGKLNTD